MPSSSPVDEARDFGAPSSRRGAPCKAPSICSVAEVRMPLQRVVGEVIAAAPVVGVEGCSELSLGDVDASMAVVAPEGEMANTSLSYLGLKLTTSEPARERGFRQIHTFKQINNAN
ncbi:hypothetical protein E2562_017471 [Oryza meyeriana var. granulata]|uniref:Uncharacterized protein n=1 Tax=Oryza meyeriana var. granulata TaxID=110450 RepID=A0A6G1DWR6_9ORYZ|nr:hypothetical protein E2562_017471 [Oryza meyeriana var. granulata]